MINIEPTVDLSVDRLIEECSLNLKTPEEIKKDLAKFNDKNVHEAFRYRKFNESFTDRVTCYNNGDSVIGLIKPSYSEFLVKISKDLGIDPYSMPNDSSLTILFNQKLKTLCEVESKEELNIIFPNIYQNYLDGKKYMEELNNMRRETIREDYEFSEKRNYYYSCAMRRSFLSFIEYQSKAYNRFVNKRKTYKGVLIEDDLTEYFYKNFDFNKLAMYVTYKYLSICNSTKDIDIKKKYFELVKNYYKSNYDKKVYIKADDDSIINLERLVEKTVEIEEELLDEKLKEAQKKK